MSAWTAPAPTIVAHVSGAAAHWPAVVAHLPTAAAHLPTAASRHAAVVPHAPAFAVDVPGAVWFVSIAALALVCVRVFPRSIGWSGFVACVSVALGLVLVRRMGATRGTVELTAFVSAALSLIWSATAAAMPRRAHPPPDHVDGVRGFAGVAWVVALLMGVTAGVIEIVILVMRTIYAGLDVVLGAPSHVGADFGYGYTGLVTAGLLLASSTVALIATRDARLVTLPLWSAVVLGVWACLLTQPLAPAPTGGYVRTGVAMHILLCLAAVMALTTLADVLYARRATNHACLRRTVHRPRTQPAGPRNGYRASAGAIALAVVCLVCYHIAIPSDSATAGLRTTALMSAAAAGVCAYAVFRLVRCRWSINLAEVGMALVSVGLASLAVAFVPDARTRLASADRVPMVFTAAIVGLGVATAMWTWLADIWTEQFTGMPPDTTAAWLAPHARRFSFFTAALATLLAVVMAVWPRLPMIAPMDDSLTRVTAGLAANLFLLLVMLWCARHVRRLTFHLLTALAFGSAVGFIVIRMIPFTTRF
ncbi:MAG: hypothetical protein ACE5E6_04005 [Phycisphaerae bacterium]